MEKRRTTTVIITLLLILIHVQPLWAKITFGKDPFDHLIKPESKHTQNIAKEKGVCVRILLTKLKKELKVAAAGGLTINDLNGDKVFEYNDDGSITLTRSGDGIQIATDRGEKKVPPEIIIRSKTNDSVLVINYKKYRGSLKVINRDGFLWLINVLDLEKYLYGVVPREFRTNYPEMAKAQAVVARTFAIAHLDKYDKLGYDFSSGTRFQVYGGYDAEDPACNKGVDSTRGQVLAHNGELLKYPLYHSTCGGATADNENVFLSRPIAYLRSVPCSNIYKRNDMDQSDKKPEVSHKVSQPKPRHGSGMDEMGEPPGFKKPPEDKPSKDETKIEKPMEAKEGRSFVNFLEVENECLCSTSKYFRWEVEIDEDRMAKNLQEFRNDKGIREVNKIKVIRRGRSKRVREIAFYTNKGEIHVEGDKIRRVLKFEKKNGYAAPLYSTRFILSREKQGGKNLWRFKGAGWGHGLGLCQYGALGLARKGWKCKDILKKYYTGAEVVNYRDVKTPR